MVETKQNTTDFCRRGRGEGVQIRPAVHRTEEGQNRSRDFKFKNVLMYLETISDYDNFKVYGTSAVITDYGT